VAISTVEDREVAARSAADAGPPGRIPGLSGISCRQLIMSDGKPTPSHQIGGFVNVAADEREERDESEPVRDSPTEERPELAVPKSRAGQAWKSLVRRWSSPR